MKIRTLMIVMFLINIILSCCFGAEKELYSETVNIKNACAGKDLIIEFSEIERNKNMSIVKVKFISGSSFNSSMFILKCMSKIAIARGAQYFMILEGKDDKDGNSLYKVVFADTEKTKDYVSVKDCVLVLGNE